MTLQPYQEASEEIIRQSAAPFKFAGQAASLGTAVVGSGAILNKVLPFLNSYIPKNLAMKGISKINPILGKFIQSSEKQGHSMDDILDFIKQKAGTGEQQKPPEQQNIISQYSPELLSFLEDHITKGRAPLEAGALAQLDPKFKKIISKMEADHKAPFSSILQTIFGENAKDKALKKFIEHKKKKSMMEEIRDQFKENYGDIIANQQGQQAAQAQQSQAQPGNADQALLAALDKILKM